MKKRKISDLSRVLYESIVQLTDSLIIPDTFYRGGAIPENHDSAVFFYLSGTKFRAGLNSYCVAATIVGGDTYKIEKEIKGIIGSKRLEDIKIKFDSSRYHSVKENKEVDSSAGINDEKYGRIALFFTIDIDNSIWALSESGEPYLLEN